MYIFNGSIYMEDSDQCNKCEHLNKGVACPLIQALHEGVVYIPDDITMSVTNCGFYKEHERKLKIVKGENNGKEKTKATEDQSTQG